MPEKDIQFYTVTKDAWGAMLKDIYSAQKSIDIEQYIFTHDVAGDQFIDALIQKARQGVSVRLAIDMVGSYNFYNSTLVSELRDMGIQIRFFNPIKPWRIRNFFTSSFFRDHRKIMIVDGLVGYLGGVGIEEKMELWRDTHMRIAGPLVLDIQESFDTVWKGLKKWRIIEFKRIPHFTKKYNLLTNAPTFRQRYIYRSIIDHIRNAKNFVYLLTPYFVPDQSFFRVLRLAARRGVDVKLIVPKASDVAIINYAQASYFKPALKAGIKIYLYEPTMMHAKAVIVDDWATAGTFNLDNLSFFFNYEANVSSIDPDFVNELKKHFEADLKYSQEIKYETWVHRPIFVRFLEYLTWPIHGIL
jgi:cardiolipin synthase